MSQASSNIELKIIVLKLLELSYRQNEGLMASLVHERESTRLTVNASGQATFSGKAGILAFSASEAIQQAGLDLRHLSILFSPGPSGTIAYTATFQLTNFNRLAITGSIDVEKL